MQSKETQESSPTPQFKSINSWALSFLYGPTLTSIHDDWNNKDLQIEVHAFLSPLQTSPSAFSSSTWKCQFASCSTNSILYLFISHAIGACHLSPGFLQLPPNPPLFAHSCSPIVSSPPAAVMGLLKCMLLLCSKSSKGFSSHSKSKTPHSLPGPPQSGCLSPSLPLAPPLLPPCHTCSCLQALPSSFCLPGRPHPFLAGIGPAPSLGLSFKCLLLSWASLGHFMGKKSLLITLCFP